MKRRNAKAIKAIEATHFVSVRVFASKSDLILILSRDEHWSHFYWAKTLWSLDERDLNCGATTQLLFLVLAFPFVTTLATEMPLQYIL